jgi:predicted aconitase
MQIKVGQYFGARDMVEITSVHISGDVEELGQAGVEFLDDMARLGAKRVVPTMTDPRGAELTTRRLVQDPAALEIETRIVAAFAAMGFLRCDNCIVYQTTLQPHFREHVAWGDTGSVIYANSVLGARSNFEGGPAALAAALTGRTPRYGFHLDSCRRSNVVVRVKDQPRELADWGALGCHVGRQLSGYWDVPIFQGLEVDPSSNALKHLGAALASFGSVAMFHIPGVTPESPRLRDALRTNAPRRTIVVPSGTLGRTYATFDAPFTRPDLVVFSAPQLSLLEMAELAEALAGRRVASGVRLFATTNPQVKASADLQGLTVTIEGAGGEILSGVCFYLMTPRRLAEIHGFRTLVTNSAKLANIMSGQGYAVKLRRFKDCIDAAVTGRVR